MKKENLETILETMLATGGDFAEIYQENSTSTRYNYIDSKLDSLVVDETSGVGLRLADKNNVYYASSSDLSLTNLKRLAKKLSENIHKKTLIDYVLLKRLRRYRTSSKTHYTDEEIKSLMDRIDKYARSKDKRINQVNIVITSNLQDVIIANHTGLYTSETRIRSRIFVILNFKDEERLANIHFSKGVVGSLDFLDSIDFNKEIDTLVKEGLDKLYASDCIGKEMPVIIENGFGGVIFHEACGHALEATLVAPGISVLANELNNEVASSKVTLIDDATLKGEWGSNKIDDEGNETRKNVLIKNGVLTGYLIDELNSRKMKLKPTSSSRRESYLYAPTSRMSNTYLASGTDTFEDMLKDIKLGLYCAKMGGGCVSPETGDFNFAVDLAYMIRDGKICECVKSASLIGNTKDILKKVCMVGSNLELGQGMCGSISGYIPVNVGMPRIKVSSILVGGQSNEE